MDTTFEQVENVANWAMLIYGGGRFFCRFGCEFRLGKTSGVSLRRKSVCENYSC